MIETKKEGTGVCFFAYNNEKIDYIRLAHIAASYVKKNMKNNSTCLVTDEGSIGWIKESIDSEWHDEVFDHIVITSAPTKQNPRRHHDSPWTEFSVPFLNDNKNGVIDYTPFEKTLLVDTDYFIQNNFYDYIFDTDNPISMHRTARYLEHQAPYANERELNEAGIHHWWSTVVYFDQSEESKIFFGIWEHVKENWDYYALLYQFPPALFRTDFCVSIAAHMMNGFNNGTFVDDFMGVDLINMDQKDDLIEVKDSDDLVLLVHDRKEPWKNILTRIQNTNIHLMNKLAVSRHSDKIIEHLRTQHDT